MLAAGFGFACMNVCVKFGAEYFSAAEMVFYRALLSMMLIYPLLRFSGDTVHTEHKRLHFVRGISGFLSLFLYYYALTILPMATAVTLNYTSPIFLALIVLVIARERLHWPLAGAIIGAFVGTALLLKPTFNEAMWFSGLLAVGSGAIAAIAYHNVWQLVQAGESEARVVFYFSFYSALAALLWLLFTGFHPVTSTNVIYLLGIGVFATVAQLALTRAYGKGKTLVTGALSYSTVVFSCLLGVIFFADLLTFSSWVGIALIVVAGIVAIRFAPSRQPIAATEE